MLNLFNNAFYAVAEKMKSNLNGYQPTVTVSSKKINDHVEITVVDNGNGIPKKVLDKIFQPSLLPNLLVREQDWDCL
jgi:signal transduction histidine kinase